MNLKKGDLVFQNLPGDISRYGIVLRVYEVMDSFRTKECEIYWQSVESERFRRSFYSEQTLYFYNIEKVEGK